MATSAVNRRPVLYYEITKKRKRFKDDNKVIRIGHLTKARELARKIFRENNLQSLTNSNGIKLTI